jgi:tRNA(Ile)-lysidine synthase
VLSDESLLCCEIRDALLAPLAQASAILLAVSGGPDSTALLKLAADWRAADPSRPDIFAASVDHGLRPEARAEVEAVAELAQKLGVPHAILTWEGEKPRSALQEKARAARYGLLVGHARAIGADSLCTAHHADDQAKTVLMRMARGSGIAGLAGMRPVSAIDGLRLLRPLLDIPKSGLVAFCHAQGLAFAQDASNVDDRFARARMRKLAGVLAAEGLSAARFTELARRAARADDALASMAQHVTNKVCTRPANGARIDFAALLNEPEEIGLRVLAGEIAHLSEIALRLHRLESAFARLAQACGQGESLKLSLGGTLLHLDAAGELQLRAEPARRRGRVKTMQSVHVID